MARMAKHPKEQAANGPSLLTLALIGFGFVIFYFASQALTPEDAHLLHWGLAAAGAAAGWLIGTIIERFR